MEKSLKLIMWKLKRENIRYILFCFPELPHSRKDTQNFLTIVDIEAQVCYDIEYSLLPINHFEKNGLVKDVARSLWISIRNSILYFNYDYRIYFAWEYISLYSPCTIMSVKDRFIVIKFIFNITLHWTFPNWYFNDL